MPRSRAKINKSLTIREIKQRDSSLKTAEIVQLLKSEHGVDVSPNYVSNVLAKNATNGNSNGSGKRRGRPPKIRTSGEKASASSRIKLRSRVEQALGPFDSISFDTLKKAKSLADAMGGIEIAKTALEALSQIVD